MSPSVSNCEGILIVEDHAATARLLQQLLSDAFDDRPVIAVGSAEEMICSCLERPPRIVIMDISLPGMNGIEATRWIKSTAPTTSIVIHSNLEPAIYLEACLRAGATVYVRKAQPTSRLIEELGLLLGS